MSKLAEALRMWRDANTSALDAAATFGTGMAASALGGIAGVGTLLRGRGVEQAAKDVEEAQRRFTWQPRTDQGQRVLENVAAPFEALDKHVIQPGADAVFSATGSPALGAGAYALGNMIDPLKGKGKVPKLSAKQLAQSPRLEFNPRIPEFSAVEARQSMIGRGDSASDFNPWRPMPTPDRMEVLAHFLDEARNNQNLFELPLAPDPSVRDLHAIADHFSSPEVKLQGEQRFFHPDLDQVDAYEKKHFIGEGKADLDEFDEQTVLWANKGEQHPGNNVGPHISISDSPGGDASIMATHAAPYGQRLYQALNTYLLRNGRQSTTDQLTHNNAYRILGNHASTAARHGEQPRNSFYDASHGGYPIDIESARDVPVSGAELMLAEQGETDFRLGAGYARRLGQDAPARNISFDPETQAFYIDGARTSPQEIAERLSVLEPMFADTKVGPKSIMRGAVTRALLRSQVTPEQARTLAKEWKLGPIFSGLGAAAVGLNALEGEEPQL